MIHQIFLIMNLLGSEWVLGVLAILSVVALSIVVQRWAEISRLKTGSERLWRDHLQDWFDSGGAKSLGSDFAALRVEYPSLESEVLGVIKNVDQESMEDRERIAQAYLNSRKLRLERSLSILGTIGANAPFIGLLGTVLGIIRAFHQIALNGLNSGMDGMAGGIAEALVATAVGLFVAVPSIVFFNLLNKRVSTLLSRAQTTASLAMGSAAMHGKKGEGE